MYQFRREEYEKRMEWFRNARFGMFIHWGLYAIPARGEWVRNTEEMPREDYMVYFDTFDPVDYDPRKWVRAAKMAGMQYVVLTAKHHDGFCLFDSAYTDFKSTNTKLGRDVVADFLEAAREEGLRVGLYYSLLDWNHPDYPHYGDKNHPMRNNPCFGNENRDFNRYLDYMHSQVRELCANYGKCQIQQFAENGQNDHDRKVLGVCGKFYLKTTYDQIDQYFRKRHGKIQKSSMKQGCFPAAPVSPP